MRYLETESYQFHLYTLQPYRMERHHVSLMVVMFLVVLCVSQCIAQVNFSPNWGGGKRSADPPDECRSSMDSLKYIYKLIQSEAQKLYEFETGLSEEHPFIHLR
ncbi:hypothetical protein M8J75_004165 [Diaphorina citri]|nr:hypothetical protein M8J75_004165 [Diaphorina citri]